MDWTARMNAVMDYFEDNLSGEISYEKAAQLACCSVYHFQRMFSFVAEIPPAEYIRRRRLTAAAFALQEGSAKVIDLAYQYGYESPEAFSRAFKKQHGVTPAAVRGKDVALRVYPKITFSLSLKGDAEMHYRLEQHEAFALCGFSTAIRGGMTAPKFLRQLHKSGQLQQLYRDLDIPCLPQDAPATPGEPESLFFALYDFQADCSFSYLIGHNKPDADPPPEYETLCIPAQTWAIFSSPQDIGADPALQCKRAWNQVADWFAASDYEHAPAPELERGFNRGNMDFYYEVWIPVVKK